MRAGSDCHHKVEVTVLPPQNFAVSVTATTPADPVAGQQVPASDVSTTVIVPANFAGLFPTALGVEQIEGTVDATTTIDNAGTPSSVTAPGLVIPETSTTATHPDGSLSLTASGTHPAVTYANSGATTISLGAVQAKLKLEKADGEPAVTPLGSEISIPCTLAMVDGEAQDPNIVEL